MTLIIYPGVSVLSQNVENGDTKYGRITLGNMSRKLTRTAKHALDGLAINMKQDTTCGIFIMSHGPIFANHVTLLDWIDDWLFTII